MDLGEVINTGTFQSIDLNYKIKLEKVISGEEEILLTTLYKKISGENTYELVYMFPSKKIV